MGIVIEKEEGREEGREKGDGEGIVIEEEEDEGTRGGRETREGRWRREGKYRSSTLYSLFVCTIITLYS